MGKKNVSRGKRKQGGGASSKPLLEETESGSGCALRAGTCLGPGHPTMVPGHFHPPFQVQAAAGLLALETRGVHFVTAEGLGEVCGVFSRQATGGWQAGGALGMAHELTF